MSQKPVESTDFPNYQAGTRGPEEAETLIAQNGISWITPSVLKCKEDEGVCRVTTEPRP